MQFTSAHDLALLVRELAPAALEIHAAAGEDVTDLAALLHGALEVERQRAAEVAEATIARAARC